MKYLLVILLILVVFWLWQHERRTQKDAGAPPPRPPVGPGQGQGSGATEIVACSVCQVHLPRAEALTGRGGNPYCCEAHRRKAEG